ncbi:MAG: T9SS type A sorting domain-containing protein [Bacteroidales bacterium]|nr:T9SS type A sorting domain-containing protein [Bacteroidales bacterium]
MNKKSIIILELLLFICSLSMAQFPPAAGQEGTTAIHAESAAFIEWAVSCEIDRGWINVDDQEQGKATHGTNAEGIGKPDNSVVSLGDGGKATLSFDIPIIDGENWDFAVFENSFSDYFLELAFVEVSSDGEHFFRFPAISLTQTETQIGGFDSLYPTNLHNLAGKYRGYYGVPFDIAELPDTSLLDKDSIVAVRLVDVIGSIHPDYATYDSESNIVNDPWPTVFESSGFDLDAVGVIHNRNSLGLSDPHDEENMRVYPNPAHNYLKLETGNNNIDEIRIVNLEGRPIKYFKAMDSKARIDISDLERGTYLLRITAGENRYNKLVICK